MEEGTCHEMVIDILKSFSCMNCLYLHFFISFKNDFQVDVERMINEPVHEISNNSVCATSKGSDQPAHTRRLIRAFASRLSIL